MDLLKKIVVFALYYKNDFFIQEREISETTFSGDVSVAIKNIFIQFTKNENVSQCRICKHKYSKISLKLLFM